MTTEELERDLKTLAEPRAEDERLRLAIRATLGEQLQVRPKIRRRTRLVLGSAAVTAATLAAAAVVLIGTGGSGPSSANAAILAHVVRAISPPANIIVHVKEAGVQRDGTQVAAEWWQETNPPYAIRLIKGTSGQPVESKGTAGGQQASGDQQVESAADGTTFSQYDAGLNTIYQRPDSTSPALIDPIEAVRAALANGTAHVAGRVTIGGQSLYKIELPNGVVGYFDRTDYRPVYLDNPQRDGSVVRTRVTTYEELSLTSQNELLLSIAAQHPRASVDTGPPPASAKQK
jgi:hypothetical protein